MSRTVTSPPPGFDELSAEEQVACVLDLWERLVPGPEAAPAPEWHRTIVRQRLDAHRDEPDAARPWSEVRADLERLLAQE